MTENEEQNREVRRSDPLKTLSLILVVGAVVVGVCIYAMGWVDVEQNADTTSIELQTGEMKKAADEAVQSGERMIERAGDALREVGDNLSSDEEADADADAEVQSQNNSSPARDEETANPQDG